MHLKTSFTICLISAIFTHNAAQNPAATIIGETQKQISEMPAMKNLQKNEGMVIYGDTKEGLRVARDKNGLFGYLERQFDWILPPLYEAAFAFSEGLGIVFENGQPRYIDSKGQSPFPTDYAKDLAPFKNGRALFRTHTGKMGMLDKTGKLLIDTVFKKIYDFSHNSRQKPLKTHAATIALSIKSPVEYALIDTNGNFIAPFGRFSKIDYAQNMYDVNTTAFEASNAEAVALYDLDGRELFYHKKDSTLPYRVVEPIRYESNLILVKFPSKKESDDSYMGLINGQGELVFNNKNAISIMDFDDKWVWFYEKTGKFTLLSLTNGEEKRIQPAIRRIPLFSDLKKYGAAAVSATIMPRIDKSGILDSCFNWILPPQYDRINLQKSTRETPHFILTNYISKEQAQQRQLKPSEAQMTVEVKGIADLKGVVLVKPDQFSSVFPLDSALSRFAFTMADSSFGGLVDRTGTILKRQTLIPQAAYRKQASQTSVVTTHKIEWKVKVDNKDCEIKKSGFREVIPCNIYEKATYKAENPTLHVQIDKTDSTTSTLNSNHSALKARLMNGTKNTVYLPTKDQNLKIKIQAQDASGNWRTISYHRAPSPYEKQHPKPEKAIELPPQYFWTIELPTFVGNLTTQFRCLIATKEGEIVSETWEGSVSLTQFWQPPFYRPEALFGKWEMEEE